MKKCMLSVWLGLAMLGPLQAQNPLRELPNYTFNKGEFLKLRVHYGFITAGFATLEVKPYSTYEQGRKCHHIIFKGFTSPSFDLFYTVRDRYESYFDEKSLISWRFNRYIQEGKFTSYSETHFDHQLGRARYIDQKERVRLFDIPRNIQDVISAYYFARTRYDHRYLKIGDRISMRNFIDRKTFALEAKLLARETVKISGVRYKALKFKLLVEEVGMITDGSTITFWISDDFNKVPLRIESELMIGSLKADLIEHKNLRHPFTAKLD